MPDKIRILLIDDDEEDYIITRDIIDDIPGRNYRLDWSRSFSDALDIIEERRHDVYLVDYRLGANDGLELIRESVRKGCSSPFILLTGQTDRETDEKAMRAGALDYIVKGKISPNELERSIRYSIEHAKSLAVIQRLNSELEQRVKERTQELGAAIQKLEQSNRSLYEAEKEVRKALQKEKELHELKSRFVTIASHEFRTPLSTVLSSASLISKYTSAEDDDKRLKHVDRIKSAVSNLTSILNDFLSISRIEEGKIYNVPSTFELKSFAKQVVEEAHGVLKPGQYIHYDHLGYENTVHLDKQLFKNILFNLLSNASKYSGEDKRIQFTTEIQDGRMVIIVADEGIGIPDADKSHLFSPFFRAQNVTNIQGTGLGLNIVKKYVEIMGGSISYQSEIDKGTTFTITLPQNSAT